MPNLHSTSLFGGPRRIFCLLLFIPSCSIQQSSCYTCYTCFVNNGLADKTSTEPGLVYSHKLWCGKTRMLCMATRWWTKFLGMFTCLDRIHERDERTHTRTDGQTDTARRHRPRLCVALIAWCDKFRSGFVFVSYGDATGSQSQSTAGCQDASHDILTWSN